MEILIKLPGDPNWRLSNPGPKEAQATERKPGGEPGMVVGTLKT